MADGSDGEVDMAALMDTTRILTAVVAHSLATLNATVSVPQLRVLVMIDTQGPLNLSAVADGLGVNASNASRTCERLVGAGLLDRRPDERDRRSVVLRLTRRGQRLVDTVVRQREAMLAQIVSRMSPDQQQRLSESLGAFVTAASDVSSGGQLRDGDGHLLRHLL
jgi:DNA-binding MarR family transcriptional regulator